MLPDKPSALIRVALVDLRKVEADPLYTVDMGAWHDPYRDSETCHVCLAGAVMAKTLGVNRHLLKHPSSFDLGEKLYALDYLRVGAVNAAIGILGFHPSGLWIEEKEVPDYQSDPEPFHAYMNDLSNRLEAAGL